MRDADRRRRLKSSMYRQNATIEFKPVEDGYVFYNENAEHIVFLNLTAAAIFECCQPPADRKTIDAILQASGGQHLDSNTIEACLQQLIGHGLLIEEPE